MGSDQYFLEELHKEERILVRMYEIRDPEGVGKVYYLK